MDVTLQTIRKIKSISEQISTLEKGDFPHPSSRDALHLFADFFSAQRDRVMRAAASNDANTIRRATITANERITQFLPVLGFLLRSTNVRNSFECYDAFVGLAKALIGSHAKVVLSSEWDFSPLTYPMTISVLPGYVLLGMPASESANALVLPLAGHELGHSVWQQEQLENFFEASVQDALRVKLVDDWVIFAKAFPEHAHLSPTTEEIVANIFLSDIIAQAQRLALSQIEEFFCDAVGVNLFGESFILAFHYLLAPSLGGNRPLEYPMLRIRAFVLSTKGGIDCTTLGFANYPDEFDDRFHALGSQTEFISDLADHIAIGFVTEVSEQAAHITSSRAGSHLATPQGTYEAAACFMRHVPCGNPRSIGDILNAGWQYVRRHPSETVGDRDTIEWISELMLKSMEGLEMKRRLERA